MSAEEERERRFRARLERRASFESDRAAGEQLVPEAMTVVDAILEAAGGGPLPEPGASELREALTLLSLLGRRAALLDATVAVALGLAEAVLAAADLEAPLHLEPMRVAAVDGYVRAREEREAAQGARRAADAIPVVELAPGCLAIFLRGEQDAEELERVTAELGRTLLERDARACLVDAAGLRGPDRERAASLFGIHATCLMLGVRAVYSGVGAEWRAVAEERGIDLSEVRFLEELREALPVALAACDLELRAPPALRRALERLVGL